MYSLRIPPPVQGRNPERVQLTVAVGSAVGSMEISAYVVQQYFAIHLPINSDEHGFYLSHIPTGRKIAWSEEISKLFTVPEELGKLGDWSFAELEGVSEEIQTGVRAILDAHGVSLATMDEHLVQ